MEFKDVILLHEDFLADFGFRLDNRSLHYVKEIPQGKQMVFFHHTQHEDGSYLEYHLGIRLDHVENIVHRFLPSLGDYKERSITLVETMDRIDGKMPRRFLVENDLEINGVIREVEGFLVKKGFRFLDQLSSGKALEEYFNEDPDTPILTQNFTYRSARGITLTKLFNPKNYERNKKTYLNMLNEKQVTPFTLACFINLLDFLENLK
ncbi:hypothetical protein [Cecembia rubra]|uniref:Uncharacterized protein n=1 Tax=Cecembia rubra TaxID=1485585 RepID=A0A2P8EDJ0_9BACT|nr:hypothetical protein [Cecembia rubra]PSL07521.1 hypothetical protein CLV48_101453 [Cecembia rubra]